MLHYITLHYIIHNITLHYITLYIILHYIVLYFIIIFGILLNMYTGVTKMNKIYHQDFFFDIKTASKCCAVLQSGTALITCIRSNFELMLFAEHSSLNKRYNLRFKPLLCFLLLLFHPLLLVI